MDASVENDETSTRAAFVNDLDRGDLCTCDMDAVYTGPGDKDRDFSPGS